MTSPHPGPPPPHRAPAALVALAFAAARCGEESAPACRAPVGWMDERIAALPEGTDAWRCVPVGDGRGHSVSDFPDIAALTPPVTGEARYVRAGAPAGGDGTMSRPFADLETALRSAGSPTIVLSRGRHGVSATVTLTSARAIVGGGTDDAGTSLVIPPGAAGLVVEGAAAALTLVGVHLRYVAPTRDVRREIALQARGGARLALRDVLVSRSGSVGVLAEGSGTTLDADRVTVREGLGNGFVALDGARAVLRRFSAFRNAGVGVYAQRAHLHAFTGLVAGNATAGVQLRDGAGTGGAAACGAEGPVGPDGEFDCFREVSITCNGIAGLVATGARALDLRRSAISDTRPGALQAADGLSVLDGARVSLDADLRAAVDGAQSDFARGTRVLANRRVGVLVSGSGASLDARGASIDGNRLGGIIVQRGADLQTLQAARLTGNGGVGLALTDTTRVAEVQRCSFAGTFMATFQTDQGMIAVGDGLSMASATGMIVTRSRFDANGRFGILLRNARGSVTNNEGDRNGIGIGAYGTGGLTLENNRVLGAAPMPGTLPAVASAITP